MKMLLNCAENEKLFAKVVPVLVKNVYESQSRTNHLLLTIEWQESSAGMYNTKVLSLSLTDNDDPYFLHQLNLSEEDFQKLKTNQDLLIHFSSFPQHIIDYIEMCLQEEKNPQPKFLLVFTVNEKPNNSALLDIVETNSFKHLTHLSLKFFAATETTIRQFIGSSFRRLKEEKRQLQNHLASMERDLKDKLAACQHTLNAKMQEFELVKKDLNVQLSVKDSQHQAELQEERDRLISRHKDEINSLEKEIKMKEHTFRKEIQQLESRVNVLDTLNKELQDKNYNHESTIREFRSKIHSLEDETKHLKENLQSYKHKCEHLQSEVKEKQSHIRQKTEKVNDLQQELRSKEQSILKLKDQIESENDLKRSLETELENAKFHLDMSEQSRKVLENENAKLNEVIIGLQEKSKEITKEEKAKGHLAAKFKKTIEEKDKALLDLKQEITQLKIGLENKNYEALSSNESKCILQKKIDELNIVIRDRDNVIKWMSKQLTDNSIVPQYIPPPHLTRSPTALDPSALAPSTLAQKQLAQISSKSPGNSPPVNTGKNATAKSVRIEAALPVCKRNSSSPSHFNKTGGTDSAYCTASLNSNQATPEILAGNRNTNFDPSNFEIDHEALSAAFGDGTHVLKHSTAKKPVKPVKSTTPKIPKKR